VSDSSYRGLGWEIAPRVVQILLENVLFLSYFTKSRRDWHGAY